MRTPAERAARRTAKVNYGQAVSAWARGGRVGPKPAKNDTEGAIAKKMKS